PRAAGHGWLRSLMLISVLTPCLNRAELVGEAVESVRGQHYAHVEHLILDGGSTDGTLQVLATYPHLIVSSKPDAGLYEALNRGLAAARGEIIGILNTDDCYARDIFGAVAERFCQNPWLDAVVGG